MDPIKAQGARRCRTSRKQPRKSGSAAARRPKRSLSATEPTIPFDSVVALYSLSGCRQRRRHSAFVVCGLALASLSGCGWFSSSSPPPDAAQACPTAVILRPLAQTAVFGTQGRRQVDVGFYGRLSEVEAKCQISGDTVRASLDLVLAAERGASAKGDGVDLEYFVAVTGSAQSTLSKKTFPIHINVPAD